MGKLLDFFVEVMMNFMYYFIGGIGAVCFTVVAAAFLIFVPLSLILRRKLSR
jgi:hypothetical protein